MDYIYMAVSESQIYSLMIRLVENFFLIRRGALEWNFLLKLKLKLVTNSLTANIISTDSYLHICFFNIFPNSHV